MSVESVMLSNHLMLFCSLLLLPLIFPGIRVFSNEFTLYIRGPKYWSFSISSCNEYSGLISFRTDCLDILAVQGTLKRLLQHHSSEASILWHSTFMVQLSHLYMITGKNLAASTSQEEASINLLWNYKSCCVGPPKTDKSWWRVLTKCGPLEKEMANHFNILALRTPWRVF